LGGLNLVFHAFKSAQILLNCKILALKAGFLWARHFIPTHAQTNQSLFSFMQKGRLQKHNNVLIHPFF